jgi:Family of unknown function (DUF6489)
MKITIDIDCSPDEARAFLGLPDVSALQAGMMKELEERMRANMKGMDAETLMKTWMPAGAAGLEQMQKAFWQQFAAPPKK